MTEQKTLTLTFTDTNFDAEVLQSDIPVLVDVWTEGCGGCRQLAPLIDVMANEYTGKAKVGKLDAMSNNRIAMRYSIRALPTLLVFKAGNVVEQRMGPIGKTQLQEMLDPHV
jgi:thioredoxin 1